MKACILIQNQYAKVGHAIAMELRAKHGFTNFCAYVLSPGAKEFITAQTDIVYSPILVDHELHAAYVQETVDVNYIKKFETTYGPPHLWHYLYSDRKLMMSIGPKEETTTVIDPLYSHEDLLKIFQARAKAIEAMLQKERPDVIFFFAIGTIGHLLLFHIAKKLGIKTVNIDFPRIGNLISLSEDYNTLTGVETLFKKYQELPEAAAQAAAKKFLENFRSTGSLGLEYLEIDKAINPAYNTSRVPKISKTIRYLITLTKNYLKNRELFTYGMTDMNPLRFVLYKCRQRIRQLQGLDELFSDPIPGEEYAFYPLHYEPELATLLLSPAYFDQVALIRNIARSLPLHYKLYVKEHPTMIFRRPKNYYRELLKIPNVRLMRTSVRSAELVKAANIVTVITGTVGWEACLLGKPVVSFGEVFYNALPGVRRVHNLETLPQLFRELIDYPFAYKEEDVVNFVAAAIKDGIPFDFAGIWYETDFEKIRTNPGLVALCRRLGDMTTGA